MSTEAMAPAAPEMEKQLHSPPASNQDSPHKQDGSDSELSDLEDVEEDLIGDVEPEYMDGTVPVFKPTMEQFKSFEKYMKKINPYGMKSGIVKVIPPPEWSQEMPRLDEAIKRIKVKEPIKQDIMGTSGTYRQANILHQRSYNLPQWRQLCEQSEHQPPAKRGERRLNQDKNTKAAPRPKGPSTPSTGGSKKKGTAKKKGKAAATTAESTSGTPDRLPTPVSPTKHEDDVDFFKNEGDEEEEQPNFRRMGGIQAPASTSVSSRRKYNRREAAAKIDEEAFKDFKYELEGEDYSPERCEELERAYWKTLTYAPPLYGADMPGSLFTEKTTTWNLGKLENLLDVMGTTIPGVNTAYLYLGMWKATFAWHLEDVDLYSINYLHFGAPKQWYSISQGDARRFEAAMRTIWPTDAKACDQFLRHKTFLISPSHLLQNFNIRVNKIVHHPGEFVITFPYGYHSGYNLGYNCAEAVNFALDSWLEYGRVAKKCDCSQAQDSVWIDIREIERKMRGEETDYESLDEEEEEEEDETGPIDLPTPPDSNSDRGIKVPKKKRKRPTNEAGANVNVKRIRVRIKPPTKEPCILCPNDIPSEPLLPTEDGEKAHRMCALYIPETFIEQDGPEMVKDVRYINKARLELKCNYCRSKKGACFQCSQKKCTRAYHATCAAAAGVFVEQGEIPVFGEDGTEYKDWGIEFSCRFHRGKRDKKLEANDLSELERVRKTGTALQIGETCQLQYLRGEIFAGAVVENRKSEEMLVIDILPRGDRIEVEYRWLVIPDPSDYHLQKPSAKAISLPKSFKAKESLNTSTRKADDLPRAEDLFLKGFTWSEFKNENIARNAAQVKVDFSKENQIWYYLGKFSTEARAQFTEDPAKPRHNPKGHFLDTIAKQVYTAPRQSYAATHPTVSSIISQSIINQKARNAISQAATQQNPQRQDKPYVYKPRSASDAYRVDPQAYNKQQNFLQQSTPTTASYAQPYQYGTDARYQANNAPTTITTTTSSYPSYTNSSRAIVQPSRIQLAPPAPYQPMPSTQSTPQKPYGNRTQASKVNPFSKYKYLQKEHNRSPLEYKSPYRPGGGFMNGYQGSLEKHLQQTMFSSRPNAGTQLANPLSLYASGQKMHSGTPVFSPVTPDFGPNHRAYGPSTSQTNSSSTLHPPESASYSAPQTKFQSQKGPDLPSSGTPQQSWDRSNSSQFHPAIRPEYQQAPTYPHQAYQPARHAQVQQQRAGPLESGQYGYPPPSQTHLHQPQTQQPQAQYPQQNGQILQNSRYYPNYQSQHAPSLHTYTDSNSHNANVAKPVAPPLHYAPMPTAYQEANPIYPHQVAYQKPSPQPPMQQTQTQPADVTHAQASPQRDFPDVDVDSTSLIEKMMMTLKKVNPGTLGAK